MDHFDALWQLAAESLLFAAMFACLLQLARGWLPVQSLAQRIMIGVSLVTQVATSIALGTDSWTRVEGLDQIELASSLSALVLVFALVPQLAKPWMRLAGRAGLFLVALMPAADLALGKESAALSSGLILVGACLFGLVALSIPTRSVAGRVFVGTAVVSIGLAAFTALALYLVMRTNYHGELDAVRSRFFWAVFAQIAVGLLCAIGVSSAVGDHLARAISRIGLSAERLSAGETDAALDVSRGDELGALAATFNQMAGSVQAKTASLTEAVHDHRQLKSRLESVFEGVNEAVIATDMDGIITQANVAALVLSGHEYLVGARLEVGLPLRTSEGFKVPISAAPGRPRILSGVVGLVPIVGTVAAMSRVDGDGGLVIVMRDVRREHAFERAKNDFLANIGHELRTPLTPIKGYGGMLRKRVPTVEQSKQWGESIVAGVDRLEHTVNRLVTFAAVTTSTNASQSSHVRLSVNQLLESICSKWQPKVEPERPLEMVFAQPDLLVLGDAGQILLAIGELVDNAMRFSTEGGEIVVGARRSAGDSMSTAAVELYVGDDGGPDALRLHDVMAAFVQGETSNVRTHEGLGLGLALSNRIAQAHEGKLLFSLTGAVTTISIILPLSSGNVEASVTQAASGSLMHGV